MPRTALLLIVVLLSALVAAAPAGGQSEGTLRDRIGSGKAQERSLASAAARLGAARAQGRARGRRSSRAAWPRPRRELDAADARLAVDRRPRSTRRAAACTRLRKRLAEVRAKLGGLLRERYMGGPPGLRHRRPARRRLPAAARDAAVRAPRRARRHARARPRPRRPRRRRPRAAPCCTALAKRRDREADAVRTRRDALAAITAGPARAPGARSPAPTPPGSPRSAAPAAAAARPSAS